MTPDEIAERIIRMEGLAFAFAAASGKENSLREARTYLKAAIVKAIKAERAALTKGQRTEE